MNLRRIGLVFICALLIFTVWFYIKHPLTATVHIRNSTYLVDIAATPQEKELGLGGRDSLPPLHGMLFPYDHAEQFSFWMKGMRFPLDIVWIRDQSIVDISKNVPVSVSGALPVYSPKVPVNKILEINAGEADKYGFQIGDVVVIDN